VRYSKKILQVAVSLFSRSRKAYEELRASNLIILPSVSTVQKYIKVKNATPNHNPEVYQQMRVSFGLAKPLDAHLIFDELKISGSIVYNASNNKIVGLAGDPLDFRTLFAASNPTENSTENTLDLTTSEIEPAKSLATEKESLIQCFDQKNNRIHQSINSNRQANNTKLISMYCMEQNQFNTPQDHLNGQRKPVPTFNLADVRGEPHLLTQDLPSKLNHVGNDHEKTLHGKSVSSRKQPRQRLHREACSDRVNAAIPKKKKGNQSTKTNTQLLNDRVVTYLC
jgi:hypothetical protein